MNHEHPVAVCCFLIAAEAIARLVIVAARWA